MGSLRLVAVEGGTGAGSHNIPVAIMSASPNISNVRTRTNAYDGKVYMNGRASTPSNTQFIGGGTALDNIQAGYYWLDGPGSGYQIYIGTRNDENGHYIGFGPIKVWGSEYGDTGAISGSAYWPNGMIGVYSFTHATYGEIMCLGYTENSDGALPARGYYILYCFGFDGVGDLVSDNPYTPPGGQAGAGSTPGGGGDAGQGNGFPDGTNVGVPDSKIDRAGVGADIYLCSAAAVKAFTRCLWGSTNSGFIDAFFHRVQNTVYNPIDSIITCHSLPTAFTPGAGVNTGIKAGGVDFSTYDGAAVGGIVTSEWVNWNSSAFNLAECWANYADYNHVNISLHLPFCGVVPLEPSEVVGGSVQVVYWCNVLNGNCAAFVVATDRDGDSKVVKVATGNAAQPCPISGNDRGMQQKLGAAIGFAQGMMSMGNRAVSGALGGGMGMPTNFDLLGNYIQAGTSWALAPQHTSVVGSLGGSAGFAGSTDVFIILDYEYPVETENYNFLRGRPSEVSGTVSSFPGYAELTVHADGIGTATDEEKREIERLCASGIII